MRTSRVLSFMRLPYFLHFATLIILSWISNHYSWQYPTRETWECFSVLRRYRSSEHTRAFSISRDNLPSLTPIHRK
jgi:hypothetical protein